MVVLTRTAVLLLVLAGCADAPETTAEQREVFERPVEAEVVVAAARNAMRFADVRVEAPAGATVRLVMDNTGTSSPAMVHNVVVVQTEAAVQRVGLASRGETLPADPAILAATPLARPGQRTAVVFTMPPPGEYPFLCTYPGHWRAMQGTLVSTDAPRLGRPGAGAG